VLSGYSGAYAFDRKSNSVLLGGRAGYYVFDRLVAEAGACYTHVRRPAEIVGPFPALTTEPEDFPMLYYQANLVLELLPNRQMVPYLGAGYGGTLLLGRNEPAVNYGGGAKLFLSRRAALRWEARVYRFRGHTRADDSPNNNIEFTLGSEFLF
jgi:outer membrane beta-barrel protein